MFQNEYHMDVYRYRRWTCPPITKIKHFWTWTLLAVGSAALAIYLYQIEVPGSLRTTALFLCLVAVYRGFFFRRMYATKQFQMMCNTMGKNEWDSKTVLGDTIRCFIDGVQTSEETWDQVRRLTVAQGHLELAVGESYIHLALDGFTVGSAEEFLAWMAQTHPEIEKVDLQDEIQEGDDDNATGKQVLKSHEIPELPKE